MAYAVYQERYPRYGTQDVPLHAGVRECTRDQTNKKALALFVYRSWGVCYTKTCMYVPRGRYTQVHNNMYVTISH